MIRRLAVAAILPTLLSFSAHAALTGNPNSVKYSDTGVKNATGRSGSAAIEARALLNRDGSATLDVTTGSLEAGTAPGTIARVQLDYPSGPTQNFNGLDAGGSFTTTVGGLIRHDRLGIQTAVRDVDPSRTDVVSVEEIVKLRPDLLVSSVDAPESTPPNFPTPIRATVREANGDAGARANCRLLANGSEVDRAEGIWVDAAGIVQCAFAPTFATVGTFALQVVVDGVNPGDWDDANNSASAELRVESAPRTFPWSASAREEEFDRYTYTKRSWSESSRTERGVAQYFNLDGALFEPVNTSTLRVMVSAESDGQLLFEKEATEFHTIGRPWMRCTISQPGLPEVSLCHDMEAGSTSVSVYYGTGDATYRSWGWATRENPFGPEVPRYTWDDTTETRSLLARFGNTVNMSVTIDDGTTRWRVEPFISSLQNSTQSIVAPYQCFTNSFSGETTCREQRSTVVTRSGRTHGS